jgi:hypothetical protein
MDMSSETFDAFYARTAWNVTSHMHSMTGQDSEADHAVREAYARAYQQWYEVSGFRDPEAWVLKVAEEAFERRRAQAAAAGTELGASEKADPGTWPGIYRPRSTPNQGVADQSPAAAGPSQAAYADQAGIAMSAGAPARSATADGAAAGRGSRHATDKANAAGGAINGGGAAGPALAGAGAGAALAGGAPGSGALTDSTWFGGTGMPGDDTEGAIPGDAGPTFISRGRGPTRWPSRAGRGGRGLGGRAPGALDGRGSRGPGQSGEPGSSRTLGIPAGLANRRMLIAGVAAIVVVAAVGAYLALGGKQPVKSPARGPGTGAKAKPTVHMLRAGQTGGRGSVPWKIVGPGWTLAELSAAPPEANGAASGTGPLSLYLVDPEGGKYLMRTWSGPSVTLLAWSGDAASALVRIGPSTPGSQPPGYGVLTLATGHIAHLGLKADVTPVGFTRPDGLNVLAIRRTARKFQLQRYDLHGVYQATLGTMPDRQAVPASQAGTCGSPCNALSSVDGLQAVWGVAGNEMQLVKNGGGLVHRLRVPASGTPPSCVPVSWWNPGTVLANCAAPGQPNANSERLWLVPANGAQPTALAPASGSPSGAGIDAAAWSASGHVYLTQTSISQCSTAASGPGGLGIQAVGQGPSLSAVNVPGSTHHYDDVVGTMGSRLLVLAQTSCPGTFSLLWLSPSAGTATTLLPGQTGQLGVVAAVPYRGAPTAHSFG